MQKVTLKPWHDPDHEFCGLYFKFQAICNCWRRNGRIRAESPKSLQNPTPADDVTRDWNFMAGVQSRHLT